MTDPLDHRGRRTQLVTLATLADFGAAGASAHDLAAEIGGAPESVARRLRRYRVRGWVRRRGEPGEVSAWFLRERGADRANYLLAKFAHRRR